VSFFRLPKFDGNAPVSTFTITPSRQYGFFKTARNSVEKITEKVRVALIIDGCEIKIDRGTITTAG
jgi:hypothetical protein